MGHLNKDDLHLSRLTVQAQLLQVTPAQSGLLPGQVPQAPQGLSPEAVARMYAELVKHGYVSLQQVPGGAQMASGDGASVLIATANVFQFVEDLTRSAWQVVVDKLAFTVERYSHEVAPGALIVAQIVDLHAVWDNLGRSADEYVSQRFLKPGVEKLVEDFGYEFNGSGVRLNLVKDVAPDLPPGVGASGPIRDSVDVRIEPLLTDKTKLFVQVTGTFAPTRDMREIGKRVSLVHEMTWDRLARSIALEA